MWLALDTQSSPCCEAKWQAAVSKSIPEQSVAKTSLNQPGLVCGPPARSNFSPRYGEIQLWKAGGASVTAPGYSRAIISWSEDHSLAGLTAAVPNMAGFLSPGSIFLVSGDNVNMTITGNFLNVVTSDVSPFITVTAGYTVVFQNCLFENNIGEADLFCFLPEAQLYLQGLMQRDPTSIFGPEAGFPTVSRSDRRV